MNGGADGLCLRRQSKGAEIDRINFVGARAMNISNLLRHKDE